MKENNKSRQHTNKRERMKKHTEWPVVAWTVLYFWRGVEMFPPLWSTAHGWSVRVTNHTSFPATICTLPPPICSPHSWLRTKSLSEDFIQIFNRGYLQMCLTFTDVTWTSSKTSVSSKRPSPFWWRLRKFSRLDLSTQQHKNNQREQSMQQWGGEIGTIVVLPPQW